MSICFFVEEGIQISGYLDQKLKTNFNTDAKGMGIQLLYISKQFSPQNEVIYCIYFSMAQILENLFTPMV